jgi:hypothetical protein
MIQMAGDASACLLAIFAPAAAIPHHRPVPLCRETPPSRWRSARRWADMRRRALGVLLLASGVLFLTAVVNPPILPYWGDDTQAAFRLASGHRGAWFTTVWLLTLAIVAAVAAVELMAKVVDSDAARIGRGLYVVGATLGLAATTFDLAVTSTLLGATEIPDWYLGVAHWADGFGTAYFALLSPAALTAFAIAIQRTRAMPRWMAVVLIVAAASLLGQYAAFRGALPFPQFLAFVVIGVGLLIRPPARTTDRALRSPAPS